MTAPGRSANVTGEVSGPATPGTPSDQTTMSRQPSGRTVDGVPASTTVRTHVHSTHGAMPGGGANSR